MLTRLDSSSNWPGVLVLSALALGIALLAGGVYAGRLSAASPGLSGGAPYVVPSDAFLELVPGSPGNCPAPPNGGTTNPGCRFVLDLMLDSGSHPDTTGEQSYLTFTYSVLQNARVSNIAESCVLTNTITADNTTYDATVQNEICNGPASCVFMGRTVGPGSIAFASIASVNCPAGCGGRFRVARVGLCATAPGQAVLHWQFSPPAPFDRDTQIVDFNGNLVQNPELFTDYVINVVAPTPTGTPVSLIVGHVTWQGAPAQPHARQVQPITLTVKMGATEVNFPIQNTDAAGFFTNTLPTLPPGTYNWRVKGPKFLANGGTLECGMRNAECGMHSTSNSYSAFRIPHSAFVEMGLLRAGDPNNDNVVNVLDFNILKSTYGKGLGDPGYDSRADFNNDNLVNVGDFNLMRVNFGQGGTPSIGPGKS